jgi:hypothetical protein
MQAIGMVHIELPLERRGESDFIGRMLMAIELLFATFLMVYVDLRLYRGLIVFDLFQIMDIMIFSLRVIVVGDSMWMLLESQLDGIFDLMPTENFLIFNLHLHINIISFAGELRLKCAFRVSPNSTLFARVFIQTQTFKIIFL